MTTQWICKTEPLCECTDSEFSCDCVLEEKMCSSCGAAMVEIDMDTGAEVAA